MRSKLVVLLFVAAMLVGACSQPSAAPTPASAAQPDTAAATIAPATSALSGKLTAAGSSALLPLMQLAATQFQQANKDVQINVTAGAATLRAEAKLAPKLAACADKAVRALTWPPSQRRDSFTSVF